MKKIIKTTRKNYSVTSGTWNGFIHDANMAFPIDDMQIICAGDAYNGYGFKLLRASQLGVTVNPDDYDAEGVLQGMYVKPNGKAGSGINGLNQYGVEFITGTLTSDISTAGVITDTNADFIADGIKPGDIFSYGAPEGFTYSIKSVDSPTQCTLFIMQYPNPAAGGNGLTASDYKIYKEPYAEAVKIAEFIADANNDKLTDVIHEANFNIVRSY